MEEFLRWSQVGRRGGEAKLKLKGAALSREPLKERARLKAHQVEAL